MSKIENIKEHFKKHKNKYIVGGCLVFAGITLIKMRPPGRFSEAPTNALPCSTMDSGVSISVKDSFNVNTFTNIMTYGGYSKKIVQNSDTGEIFDSVTSAAKAAGVDVSMMSRHLNGHKETLHGDIYRIIGLGTN